MAPLCVARRLLTALSFINFMMFYLSLLITDCNMLLTYDRHSLLNIRMTMDFAKCDIAVPGRFPLPAFSHLPTHLCWHPGDLPGRRRRRRKRGKWGGTAVRLKLLARISSFCPMPATKRTLRGLVWAPRRWLLPVVPSFSACSTVIFPPVFNAAE